MGIIAQEYAGAFRYLKALRRWVAVCIASFVGFTALAWGLVCIVPNLGQTAVIGVTAMFEQKDLFDEEPGDASGSEEPKITINAPRLIISNLVAMSMGVLLGFCPFLFLPGLPLALNGAIIGFLGGYLQISGVGPLLMLASLIPHGIFELPAMILSYALGFALCLGLVRLIIRSPKARPLGELLKETFRLFLLVVVPLILVAGLVEAYISPTLVQMLL